MAENPKAFRETMLRPERRAANGDPQRSQQKPSRQIRSAIDAANARYEGYIATINNMRDRDIERAMTGR